MPTGPLRLAAAALAVALALVAGAAYAQAEEWTLVVDHGAAAEADAAARRDRVLTLRTALVERGKTVRLLAVRTDDEGALQHDPMQAVRDASTRAVADQAWRDWGKADFPWQGAPDPAAALGQVVEDATEKVPQFVVFLGPFAGPDGEDAKIDAEAREKGRAAWIAKAPIGSRLMAVGAFTGDAWEALDDLHGLTDGGSFVLGYETPVVTTEPISLLAGTVPMRAAVRLGVTRLALATTTSRAQPHRPAAVASPDARDALTITDADGSLRIALERPAGGARTARVTFGAAPDEGTHVFALTDPPVGVGIEWKHVLPEIRLEAVDEKAPLSFQARDAEVSAPVEQRYRVRATTPALVGLAVRVDAPVPGLRAWLGDRVETAADVFESTLTVRFAPKPAHPLKRSGHVRVQATPVPDGPSLPFDLSVDAGRGRLEATTPETPTALPQSETKVGGELRIVPENGNLPATVEVAVEGEPAGHGDRILVRFTFPDGSERPVAGGNRIALPVGTKIGVRVELVDGDAWAPLDPGQLRIRAAPVPTEGKPGVVLAGQVELPYRFRRPRLVAQVAEPAYRLEDGSVTAVEPLRLTLDADGGDGQWLLARMASAPTVAERSDAPVSEWTVIDEGRGRWRVEAEGAWKGVEPAPFSDEFAGITFDVEWAGGEAPTGILGSVEVPARWGMRGWIFIGLAFLAVASATGTFLQLRAAPVQGTLLYAVKGMKGTVGRLDLAGIGRRTCVIFADARGRLRIGGEGQPIARIRPTRVGAMIESLWIDGAPGGRLMVDGVVIESGDHTLRYVAGGKEDIEAAIPLLEVPDLLGPEYDLSGGTVDALPEYTDPADDDR